MSLFKKEKLNTDNSLRSSVDSRYEALTFWTVWIWEK